MAGRAIAIWIRKQPATMMQAEDEGFEVAEAPLLQHQDQQYVEGGEADAPDQRDSEQQLQGDGGADDLGEVAGDDRDLAEYPEGEPDRRGIVIGQACARSRPVAIPSRTASACKRIAITLDSRMTDRSV